MNKPNMVLNFLSVPSKTSPLNLLKRLSLKISEKVLQSSSVQQPFLSQILPHTSVKSFLKLQSQLKYVWDFTLFKVQLPDSQAFSKASVVTMFDYSSFLPPSPLPSFLLSLLPSLLLPLFLSFLKGLLFPFSTVWWILPAQQSPRVADWRRASRTNSDSKKAACLLCPSLSHPFDFAVPLHFPHPVPPNATSDACPHLSFLSVLTVLQVCREGRKTAPPLRGVCICIPFSFHYVSVQICRDRTSVHPAECFHPTEGKCQPQTCLYPSCPYLVLFFNSKNIYDNELAWLPFSGMTLPPRPCGVGARCQKGINSCQGDFREKHGSLPRHPVSPAVLTPSSAPGLAQGQVMAAIFQVTTRQEGRFEIMAVRLTTNICIAFKNLAEGFWFSH